MTSGSQLAENLANLRGRIAAAARRSGRPNFSITLVAVTKYVGDDIVRELILSGCRDLGESRPQQLLARSEALGVLSVEPPIRWHLVGHLQRNKVRQMLTLVSLIHSADSLRLLAEIDRSAAALQQRASVLIEVNVSGDATKHGFAPQEVEPLLAEIAALQRIEVRGLMCMASREGDLVQARCEFAQLRELRDRLRHVAPPGIGLDELSMGMSGDFEVAVEEGATMVRVGSALFEGIARK